MNCQDHTLKLCPVLQGPLDRASAWQFLGCLCWKTSLNALWRGLVWFLPEWDCPRSCCCRLMIWTPGLKQDWGMHGKTVLPVTGGWWNLGCVACDFELSGLKQGRLRFLYWWKINAKQGEEVKILRQTKNRREAALRLGQILWFVCEHYSYNFKRVHALTEHVPAEDLAHNVLYKALVPPQIVFASLFKGHLLLVELVMILD